MSAFLLALLAFAFLLRVAGQLVALLAAPAWLPPFDAWHSGLLPYPLLLASQVAILAFQARVVADVTRGRGRLAAPRPRVGRALRRVALVYALVMAARYPLTMLLAPEERWSGGAIPVAFHLVLAAWLAVYAGRPLPTAGEDGSGYSTASGRALEIASTPPFANPPPASRRSNPESPVSGTPGSASSPVASNAPT